MERVGKDLCSQVLPGGLPDFLGDDFCGLWRRNAPSPASQGRADPECPRQVCPARDAQSPGQWEKQTPNLMGTPLHSYFLQLSAQLQFGWESIDELHGSYKNQVNAELVKGARVTADCHIRRLEQFFLSGAGLGHSHCWFLTPTVCVIRNAPMVSALFPESFNAKCCYKTAFSASQSKSLETESRSQRCERGSRLLSRDKQNLSLIHHWQALCLARRQRKLPPGLCKAKAATGSYSKHCTAEIFHFH